jgi:hypothetical protein
MNEYKSQDNLESQTLDLFLRQGQFGFGVTGSTTGVETGICVLTYKRKDTNTFAKWTPDEWQTPRGATGLVGPTGAFGGPPGETGLQGCTGVQGVTGNQGETGIRGMTGIGITGLQGCTGIGSQGETGIRGMTGIGITGLQGCTGIGSQGETGIRGMTGIGITGLQGCTGVQGTTGLKGADGFPGLAASCGFKTADQTTTSTTSVDITGLAVSLSASKTYQVKGFVRFSNHTAASDFIFEMTGPVISGGLGVHIYGTEHSYYSGTYYNTDLFVIAPDWCTNQMPRGSTADQIFTCPFEGLIENGSNAGTVKLQFHRVGGSSITVYRGSYLMVTQVD